MRNSAKFPSAGLLTKAQMLVSQHRDMTSKFKIRSFTRSEDCKNCPLKSQCIAGKANYKEVRRDFYQEDQERHHALVGTALYRYVMRKRQVICEGNFALQKRCHNLRFTRKRGIEKVQEQCLFSAMALNLKRLVKYGTAPLRPAVSYPQIKLRIVSLQRNLSVNYC
ncbi:MULTISPECIES: transposase [Desulfitobacterium]|uniref:transposase n=2 Tax=Desulfitobacterium TaxID=36853 RepID=UPI000379C421